MAMQCGSQGVCVSAVFSSASRFPSRKGGSFSSLSVNPKSIRQVGSLHSSTSSLGWTPASQTRFNGKFSGNFCINCLLVC